MTTVEPGASEVFTQGLRARPRSIALRASRPAPTITLGLEVLVQLVIAAMTTRPWSSSTVGAVLEGDLDRVAAARAATVAAGAADGRPRLAALVVVVLGRRVGGREGLLDRLVAAVAHLLAGLGVELLHRLEEGLLGLAPAAPGPAGASGRRCWARRRRGRARAGRRRPGPARRARANMPCSRA